MFVPCFISLPLGVGWLVVFHFVLISVFATCFILLQFLVELVVAVCCVGDLLYVVLLHFVISLFWGWGLLVCCGFLCFVAVLGAFLFVCLFFACVILLLFWESGLRLLFVLFVTSL